MLAGLAAAAMLLTGCSGPSTEKHRAYVALGDSYVAGGGIPTTTTACLRSDHDYPALLAKELGVLSLIDVSCGGATTTAVLDGYAPPGGVPLPPQIDSVGKNTDLVTIGIGGNDSEVVSKLFLGCLLPPGNTPQACQSAAAVVPGLLTKTKSSIVETLRQIKARAPRARVLLVGYLRILPDSGTCAAIPIAAPEIRLGAGIEAEIEATLRSAAKDSDVPFVSVRGVSTGHDACAGAKAWVNGIFPARNDGAFLHPRGAGMRAVADAVRTLLKDG